MNLEKQKMYAYFLDTATGIGSKTALKLLEEFETPENIYHISVEEAKRFLGEKRAENFWEHKRRWDVSGSFDRLKEQKINFIWYGDAAYPKRLRNIPDPPFALYVKGRLPEDNRKSVAVVGARKCSVYGQHVARELGEGLASAGVQVVSGMAIGIDSISQQAALIRGGDTYAVLGCGVDICYPASHRDLYGRICSQGGVLSTYPPGTQPRSELFPPRNRIISGLADAVVVVEAKEKSGTLITVDMALEQGKEIYCVPGRITDRLSDGCNKLIAQGAGIVLSVSDLVEKIMEQGAYDSRITEEAYQGNETGQEEFSRQEKLLYQLLDYDPVSAQQLHMQMLAAGEKLELQELLEALWELILKGKADTIGGWYVKK